MSFIRRGIVQCTRTIFNSPMIPQDTCIHYPRGFSSTSPPKHDCGRICWNCSRPVDCQNFFCLCGKVQKLNPHWNFFTIFGLSEPKMDIDTQELARKKRSLQKTFHPDRLTRLVKDEQVIAADLSAKVNEAYKILVDPISRAEYILSLQGSPAPEKEADSVDKEFLLEIMELSEKLEELTLIAKSDAPNGNLVKDLESLCAHIIQRRTEEMNLLMEYIKCSRWESAHARLSRVRYFERLYGRLCSLVPELSSKGVKVSVD
uniref:Iron-sulfur cluster co-chaperone protein HscB n=1 Tax=Schistocephalus solidus TaxID=70667 RepID=A0A0X3P791_SCHSO